MKELFPPIMPTYIPAFDYSAANSEGIEIPFALSNYNTISQVGQVHVSIRYQTNNSSALKTEYYNEVAVLSRGDANSSSYPYCVKIHGNNLLKNGFQPQQIYKVQIRLSSSSISLPQNPSASLLTANLDNFSEWSTVCLLMPIRKPSIYISEFSSVYESSTADSSELTFSAGDAVFNWGYEGYNGEIAKKLRLQLIQNGQVIGDSGEVSINTYNLSGDNASGYYDFSIQLEADLKYTLTLTIETKNGYSLSKSYTFTTVQNIKSDFVPILEVTMNEEDAYASVHVYSDERASIILTLRRASSKENFSRWIDMTNITIRNSILDFTYQDFTIESGVIYQYGIQVRDNNRRRSTLIKSNYARGEFEYSYLLGKSGGLTDTTKQLKLQFNNQVSSFATTIIEAKTETIGGKYPYIARNGNTYYRTFPIAGLISHFMDDNDFFVSHKDLYGDAEVQINSFNEGRRYFDNSFMKHDESDNTSTPTGESSYRYNELYDYTYERDFRERVMSFLYEDKIRLFKSPTEGNILIRLMDVSFTPKEELSRMIYEFSATAVEIDEFNIDNLSKYGILYIDPYVADLSFAEDRIGQLNSIDNVFTANTNINTLIREKHHIGETVDSIHYISGVIKYLRIEFESEPYLIDKSTMRPATKVSPQNAVTGWLINYNNTPILVMWPNNVYEFKDENVVISASTSIIFPAAVEATVDYVIALQEEPEENSQKIKVIQYEKHIGQLFDTFLSTYNFINNIFYRYTYDEEGYSQTVNNVEYIDIEAEPGTVFYLNQENETEMRRFVINFTGNLYLAPDDEIASFKRGFFYGKNIAAAQLGNDHGSVTDFPSTPRQYDYCTFKDSMYVFVNNEWLLATYIEKEQSYDLQCSVDAIVNYYLQTVRKVYE